MPPPIKKGIREFLGSIVRARKKINWSEAPQVALAAFPEPEQYHAKLLEFHLHMLCSYVHQFWQAIRLMDHCELVDDEEEQGYPASAWTTMAAFSAAFNVYHFRKTLFAIQERIGSCHSKKDAVDTKQIHEVIDAFTAAFPHAKGVRDAAGHLADRTFNPQDIDRHALADGGIILGAVWHRALVFTEGGEIIGLDINEENFDRLDDFKNRVLAAVKPITTQSKSA